MQGMCIMPSGQSEETSGGHEHQETISSSASVMVLFYVPTGTRDRWLNVPSEGQLVVDWC